MKKFEFEETSIPSQYSIDLRDNYGATWVDSRTADVYRIMFTAIADTLKFNQSKDLEKIGFIMKDDKGNFKLGAILTFKKPEEGSEEDSGNWFLECTFDEKDMEGIETIIDNHSDIFVKCGVHEAYVIASGRFKNTEIMFNMFNCAIDVLRSFLDYNVEQDGDEVEVSLKGIFVASAAIEADEKIFAIAPGEIIKQVIKNDSVL